MKNLILYLLLIMISTKLPAQQAPKPDIVIKLNGEELSGKVIEISESVVKFSYTGETVIYDFKKTDIFKITYGSGRVEIFNKKMPVEEKTESAVVATPMVSADNTAPNPGDHHNKVAVLPFAFIKDGQTTVDALSEKVQTETYAYLSRHAGIYSYVDPRTTNALLIKAGVNKENIKGYTMDEICKLLGVEYVIEGMVTVNSTTQSNYQSGQAKTTTQGTGKTNDQDKKSSGSSYSTSQQNYETSLNLNIYNDKGASIYSHERKAFFNTQDAYKNTLEYLLKRTPLYTK